MHHGHSLHAAGTLACPALLVGLSWAASVVVADAQLAAPRRVAAMHTVVELLVDRQPDASTREWWMGLRFELERDWHVYWQNPGDSGGPPTVLWQPAPGVTIGEFEWPTPERIPLGPLMNYGYTNEVILPFRVRATKPVADGTRVEGQVKWMICHDVCIPGQARLGVTLPLGPEDAGKVSGWKRQIDGARARIPKAAPDTWQAKATGTATEFVLTVRMDRPATSATFYPLEISQVNDSAPQDVKASGRDLVMRLRKSDQLTGEPRALRGVLVLASGEAYVVTAPLGSGSPRPPQRRGNPGGSAPAPR